MIVSATPVPASPRQPSSSQSFLIAAIAFVMFVATLGHADEHYNFRDASGRYLGSSETHICDFVV
jgi:hypothetical protein